MGTLFVSYMIYWQFHIQQVKKDINEQYEQRISKLQEAQKQQQAQFKKAWVMKSGIMAGSKIMAKDIVQRDVTIEAAAANLVTNKEELIGKIAKIDLAQNTPIMKSMLYTDQVTPTDLRHEQFAQIILPLHLSNQDVMDVRIQFPTGQDYIVLSKKKVQLMGSNIVSVQLNEQEILMMSSAMVDAMIHHGSIYALTYVDPEMQSASIINYPSNAEVLDLIETDLNILEKAKTALAKVARQKLEKALEQQLSMSGGQSPRQPIQDHTNDTQLNASHPSTQPIENSLSPSKNDLVEPVTPDQTQVFEQQSGLDQDPIEGPVLP
ncbi:hypothetical protein BVG16_23140 [Paenibacillus selenitireducens]|uniref:SAF domain-containing protein n=1 Tax=Paenibacillus selenitireducens TaxID=1324314 RepID=A0A1T2X4P4_9BACL|nr:SAF domain-containing protein [Paenibacillus selenitireducens]OPA74656.1 hypothetical protein BVG16_23140 [Paenibacillus selenitireducens]